MSRTTISLVAALLLPAGVAGGMPIEQGHIQWIDPGDGYASAGTLIDANGDGVRDVVVGAGDRFSAYIWCAGRGNPGPFVNARKDQAMEPIPALTVLDGKDGEPIWRREWNTGGLIGVRPERQTHDQLDGVHTGDLDGDGDDDLLVLRTTIDFEAPRIVQRTSMLDPSDGSTEWTTTEVIEEPVETFRLFVPMAVLGGPGGVLVSAVIRQGTPPETATRLVRFTPGEPPKTIVEIPSPAGALAYPYVASVGDRLRVVRVLAHITPPPNPSVSIDLDAVEVFRNQEGEVELESAWQLPGVDAFPVFLTEGSDPLVVAGRLELDHAIAFDADDGSHRWDGPVRSSPVGGLMVGADANDDGVEDVLVSPQWGPKVVEDPLLRGGLTGEIVAIDGRDGSELWRKEELAAKFGARSMGLADIDADGRSELVASYTHQDGFATCSYPVDEQGLLAVYDLATGDQRCRFSTDRLASSILAEDVNAVEGDEVIATTYGGRTYAFTNADPGCGLLGTAPG